MMIQTLPTVYVDNNSGVTLENITITFDGYEAKEPTFKKIKSGDRVSMSLYNKFVGKRDVYMKYYNEKLRITERQVIFEGLDSTFLGTMGTILVEVQSKQKDGRFLLDITKNFTL
ncbi:hypothetical protein [Robertmurraya kyonggiensis]|uniref:Uncharacterized protein n=1 Tax=Robertmurraya kyonggiensis TaxID=1037680 RepID=A0A4U1D0J6_9BACI|nr:hypothetical protein [Robertmurraya kyonggiensis]TKC14393.1 hypothetical protein FA727_21795 [Robertmurraya kyonggiensis]